MDNVRNLVEFLINYLTSKSLIIEIPRVNLISIVVLLFGNAKVKQLYTKVYLLLF